MTGDKSIANLNLPYRAEYKVIDKIVELVGREDGLPTTNLYDQLVIVKSRPIKSYNLSMAKFLDLIEAQGNSLTLTALGRQYYVRSPDEKKRLLAENLPTPYKTILSWIDITETGEMSISEIKNNIVDNSNKTPKNNLLKWMVTNFARYASDIGTITYKKGGQGSCRITDLGHSALKGIKITDNKKESVEDVQTGTEVKVKPKISSVSGIHLFAKISGEEISPFIWDIRTDKDWEAINVILESLKERWIHENKQKEKKSNLEKVKK